MIEKIIPFIQDKVMVNTVFGAAFWLTFLGSIAYQLKAVPVWLWDKFTYYIIYTCYIEETDDLYYMFESWLSKYYTEKYRNVEASIKEKRELGGEMSKVVSMNDAPNKKINIPPLFYRQFSSHFWIFYNAVPLKIFKGREKLEGARNLRSVYLNHFTIKGFRAKKIVDNILQEVTKKYAEDKVTKEGVEVNIRDYDSWQPLFRLKSRPMDSVILSPKIKECAINTIDHFINARDWFQKRGIPYKLGILLYGSPGNGKTTFIKALATKYNKSIYFLNLQGCTNNQFETVFRQVGDNSILVIEDIDSAFKNKRDIKDNKDKDQVTFTTLLNCIDGIISKEGSITIFTTNHINKLDPALIRPGRVDLKMKFPDPSINEVRTYFKKFFGKELNMRKLKHRYSMAKLQEIFIKYRNEPDKARRTL